MAHENDTNSIFSAVVGDTGGPNALSESGMLANAEASSGAQEPPTVEAYQPADPVPSQHAEESTRAYAHADKPQVLKPPAGGAGARAANRSLPRARAAADRIRTHRHAQRCPRRSGCGGTGRDGRPLAVGAAAALAAPAFLADDLALPAS